MFSIIHLDDDIPNPCTVKYLFPLWIMNLISVMIFMNPAGFFNLSFIFLYLSVMLILIHS